MLTVLIVEDELLVRIGLKNSIDWGNLGMKVIADVPNGQAALEVYKKDKPDLILTDIKMPVMGGIELISRIREEDAKTRIIILTCYEEFDLLHQALKLGVSDYILKLKMSTEEIESVLKKAREELKREYALQPVNQELIVDPGSVKENLMKDYLFYRIYSEEKFSEAVSRLGMRIAPERLVLCIMSIDQFDRLQSEFEDKQGNLIRFAILNIIDELLNGYHRGEVIHDKDERYILVFSFRDVISENRTYELLQDILSRIFNVMKTYINASVTFGISRVCSSYASLREMYRECIQVLEQSYFIGDKRYIRCDDTAAWNIDSYVVNKLRQVLADQNLLNNEFHNEITLGIDKLACTSGITKPDMQKLFIHWIHYPAAYWHAHREGASKLVVDFTERLHQCGTLEESIEVFKQYLSEITGCNAKTRILSKEIAETVQYIRRNYHRSILLVQAAEQVQMSPNYLSSLFKKDLGISFVEYMNQVRIEKAKELLLNTHLKTYEVAQKVGFTDESYFSRIFKKQNRMTPNEFRKQWFVDSQENINAEGD